MDRSNYTNYKNEACDKDKSEIRVIRGLYLGDFNTNYTNHTNVERVEFVGIIHGQFMAIRDNKNFTIYCV